MSVGLRLLMIHDGPAIRRVFARALRPYDVEVFGFGSSADADRWLMDNPAPDVVIENELRADAVGGAHLKQLVPADAVTPHGVRWPNVPKVILLIYGTMPEGVADLDELVGLSLPCDEGSLCAALATSLGRFADALETETMNLLGVSERFAGTAAQRIEAVNFYRAAAARLQGP